MLTKVNDVIFQCLWCHSCQFKLQIFSSFFDVHLWPPTLKIVAPPMRRPPIKQMFRTWVKTLLHCGYQYLLNWLVTLVVTYKKYGWMYKLSFIPSQLKKFWAIGQYTLDQYFSKVLMEILFTNGWRQPFAKLPILKLSLHNSAAVCLRQKLRRGLPENVTL